MVPQPCDIDITNYLQVSTNLSTCVTPVTQNRKVKKPLSVRRKGSPIAWKTTLKVDKLWSDEDDNSSSPTYSTRKIKPRSNLVKRVLVNDLSDDITEDSVPEDTKSKNNRVGNRNSTRKKSMKDVKTFPLVSDLSRNLDFDKSDVPAATEDVNKLIGKVENLKVDSQTSKRKRVKDKTQSTIIDHNAYANQAEELSDKLNDLMINEQTSDNADSLALTKNKKGNRLQIPEIIVIDDEEESNEIVGKQSIGSVSKLSVNETKTPKFFKHPRLSAKVVHSTRTTRSSVKKKEKQ